MYVCIRQVFKGSRYMMLDILEFSIILHVIVDKTQLSCQVRISQAVGKCDVRSVKSEIDMIWQ